MANYFEDDKTVSLDDPNEKRRPLLLKGVVIVPLLLLVALTVGSLFLINSFNSLL